MLAEYMRRSGASVNALSPSACGLTSEPSLLQPMQHFQHVGLQYLGHVGIRTLARRSLHNLVRDGHWLLDPALTLHRRFVLGAVSRERHDISHAFGPVVVGSALK
jgi:hypothetical protein